LAEWWQRLLAILIDFALFVALTVAVDFTLLPVLSSSVTATNSGASLFFDASRSLLAAALAGLVTSTVTLGYFGLLEGRGRGQSLGKRALGIAVVDAATGGLIGTMRAVLRRVILFPNLLLVLVPIVGSLLGFVGCPYILVAALSPLWDSRRQGFHDKAAKSVVVVVR
jgi:uncharacterized RDD family membrane protein YckC